MCRPSQTPHLTMSSARIDPPKRVLGLKEGVVTPPPIHGVSKITLKVVVFHLHQSSHLFYTSQVISQSRTRVTLNRVFFHRWFCQPFPLAVVSLDSRQDIRFPLSVPVLSWLFDDRGKIPKEPFPVHPPPTRGSPLSPR
ncbi:unnamed protein product [Brassica napus]|nr:unnamed protein product [Brassica napus]